MRKRTIARVLAVALGAALALGALAGCQSPATGATDQQQANRTYMTKVNQAVEELNTRLGEFDEAVAQESVVNMRNKANSAFEAIDALAAIDTPDAMKDLQTNYVDGCNKLKDALNSYIDLYTEISSATEEAPFDFSAYDGRVKEIQDAYNEGIDKLKAADEEALKLNETICSACPNGSSGIADAAGPQAPASALQSLPSRTKYAQPLQHRCRHLRALADFLGRTYDEEIKSEKRRLLRRPAIWRRCMRRWLVGPMRCIWGSRPSMRGAGPTTSPWRRCGRPATSRICAGFPSTSP